MLNLNVNYNLTETLKGKGKYDAGYVSWSYVDRTVTNANPNGIGMTYATMSIYWTPFAPDVLHVSQSGASGSLAGGVKIGFPYTTMLTGSGVWPTTGSNQFSIFITNNQGASTGSSLLMTAAAGNMNLSGSVISASFTSFDDKAVNIIGQTIHTKGNIYSPLVTYNLANVSVVSNTSPVNNNQSASFNIVKDQNIKLFGFQNVTGSTSQSFDYAFNFGVTSSLTSSIESNATGSTTMSLSIPEAGVNVLSKFYNPSSAGTKIITGSFVATTDNPYTINATIEYNKGNLSTSSINYIASASSITKGLEGNGTNLNGVSSSFKIVKDVNVEKAYIAEVTGSKSGTYNNDYAFNQTASIISNVNNTTGSVTMSLSIPEAGIFTSSLFFNPNTTTAFISAAFEAQSNVSSYNITASIINNKGNLSNANINYLATASNMATNAVTASFQIRKDATVKMVGVDDMLNGTSGTFNNTYAFNITASFSGSFTSSWGDIFSSSLRTNRFYFAIPETGFVSESISSPVNWTSSFVATTDSSSYNITASCLAYSSSVILVQANAIQGNFISGSDVVAITGLNFNRANLGRYSSSLSFYTSSLENAGNFVQKTLFVTGGEVPTTYVRAISNLDKNYFPYPYIPTYNIDAQGSETTLAYWGKPSMYITGSASTTYISGSNITIHYLGAGTTASFSASVVPTTASALLAQTLTVGGGGRGGIKEGPETGVPGGQYVFSAGGGAGGYILANNYFEYGKTYNIVVGAGAPRYDGNPITVATAQSGSDSYIYDNTGKTIQLSKGGGNGGPVTGSGWEGADRDLYGAGGRRGGSGGGGGYISGQSKNELGNESITGSVSNPFEIYGAFEGNSGGTAYTPFFPTPFIAYAVAGGGGGAFTGGGDNKSDVNGGNGGWGNYDLSFTPTGVAGGGAGANRGANATASLAFGGGDGQRYTISGSLSACDGVDGTGGGGGGLISGSLQPGQAPFNYTTKGGSGKVQIRYKSNSPLATGGVIESGSISGSLYILHTFTASGQFQLL